MIRSGDTGQVPSYLKDAHYGGARELGHGIGYKYAHDYPEHYVKQQYMPDKVKDAVFYDMTDIGYEDKIRSRIERLRSREGDVWLEVGRIVRKVPYPRL